MGKQLPKDIGEFLFQNMNKMFIHLMKLEYRYKFTVNIIANRNCHNISFLDNKYNKTHNISYLCSITCSSI